MMLVGQAFPPAGLRASHRRLSGFRLRRLASAGQVGAQGGPPHKDPYRRLPHKDPGQGRSPDVETIFVLLPLALLIAAIAVGFFVWAARTGQFDDLETPAVRILFDDEQDSGVRSQDSGNMRDSAES